jgi:hypothetical protein
VSAGALRRTMSPKTMAISFPSIFSGRLRRVFSESLAEILVVIQTAQHLSQLYRIRRVTQNKAVLFIGHDLARSVCRRHDYRKSLLLRYWINRGLRRFGCRDVFQQNLEGGLSMQLPFALFHFSCREIAKPPQDDTSIYSSSCFMPVQLHSALLV